ncbi:MAG: hypothetical protein IT208_00770 [Chthonomonadales bacterium]|nr:hypothetical protein [Chthonomonadales bacterium]
MTDVVPQAPPPRSEGGCWKWGAISCLGLGCVSVLALAALIAYVVTRPQFKHRWQEVTGTVKVATNLQEIGQALTKYVADKGKYPASLRDLTPAYLSADKLRPAGVADSRQFAYHRPPAGAPGDFVVVEYEMENPIRVPNGPPMRFVLRKNGKVDALSARFPTSTSGPAGAKDR